MSKEVDRYIQGAPVDARSKLKQIRKIIQDIAPRATERISYGMPAYDNGRIAWFGLMKKHIGLYLRPPIIAEHKKELKDYRTTKSAVQFPLDEALPAGLIKKLLRARIARNKKP